MRSTEALTSSSIARNTGNPSAFGINTTNPKPERFARRRGKKRLINPNPSTGRAVECGERPGEGASGNNIKTESMQEKLFKRQKKAVKKKKRGKKINSFWGKVEKTLGRK